MIFRQFLPFILRLITVILSGCLLLVILAEFLPGASQQVAYIINQRENNHGVLKIALLDVDHQLTLTLDRLEDEAAVAYAANSVLWWSPDGTKLAFLSEKNRTSSLHVISLINQPVPDTRGTGADTLMTTSPVDGELLDWSPDSQSIAYTTAIRQDGTNPNFQLRLASDSTSDPTTSVSPGVKALIDSQQNIYGGVWSPDGKYFAYRDGYDIYSPSSLYSQSTLDPVADPVRLTPPTLQVSELHWSPDSTRIVFVARAARPQNLTDSLNQLYLINVDHPDAEPQRLTGDDNLTHYAAVWSPDGKALVYLTGENNGSIGLTLLNIATGEARPLIEQSFSGVTAPAWSADGWIIAFSANQGNTHPSLYLVNADGTGSGLSQITTEPLTALSPAWRPEQNQGNMP